MRKILILITATFLVFIGVVDCVYVKKSFSSVEMQASELQERLEKEGLNEETEKLAIDMQEGWREKQKYLHVFVIHSETRSIGEKISRVANFVKERNQEAIVECSVLIFELQELQDTYDFNFINIF